MIYIKSPLEAAEEALLWAATPLYNVSRADALRFQVQRREVAPDLRQQAENLLASWEGTSKQVSQALRIQHLKVLTDALLLKK